MKKALQDWMKQNPDKGAKRGKSNQFEAYKEELKVLLQAGYTTQKIALYLEEVEKVKFKKKDGKNVITSLSSYLRELAKVHGISRKGRNPTS
ncbi:hypothetical protein QCB44_01530 [Thiomicrorhabdus sp. zzn3]|uniref:hypothetical protein n=1 Tax=Thiomicrorhabdus sp. zzn3 TaxID=3039775 RepID=UPI0024366529|nr:hypothetical protein [Thiomicrorhabdus sp. zzn3]MDG6777379.1 hypothetical protein [Thiomicrorhabdus sp. zzn3]